MKTTKMGFVVTILVGAAAYVCALEGTNSVTIPKQGVNNRATELEAMPYETLVGKTKSVVDLGEKSEYAAAIRKRLPKTENEKQIIIELLESDNADDKIIAMEVLGQIKEKRVMSSVIKNLKHSKDGVKMMAATTLGKIGGASAVEPLLENPDLIILEFGNCPAAEIGAPALPKLLSVAKKRSLLGMFPKQERKDRRSREAASCIGQIKDEKAAPQLIKLLRDDDSDVRLAAVQSLAVMKIKEAEPEFEKMLNDSDEWIRMSILRTLSNADKTKYLPKVMETIHAKSGFEKRHAIDLLGNFNAAESIAKLEELLKDNDEFTRHSAAHVLWKITGKVYPYGKGRDILHMEKGWRERLEDAKKTHNESPKNAIQEAQKNGYLLDEKVE